MNADTVLKELKEAIKTGDKQLILNIYDECSGIEWEDHPNLWEEYEELISKANDILYAD